MKTQPIAATHGLPESFLSKFGQEITGILSRFDRVRFQGTLRLLFQPAAMERYLNSCGVLVKEFALSVTAKVKAAAYQAAAEARRCKGAKRHQDEFELRLTKEKFRYAPSPPLLTSV